MKNVVIVLGVAGAFVSAALSLMSRLNDKYKDQKIQAELMKTALEQAKAQHDKDENDKARLDEALLQVETELEQVKAQLTGDENDKDRVVEALDQVIIQVKALNEPIQLQPALKAQLNQADA